MSIQTIAIVAVLVALPVIAQTEPGAQGGRQGGAVIMADYDYDASVTRCSVSLQGDQPILAATIALPADPAPGSQLASSPGGAMPHVRRGVEFTISPAVGGGMPTVAAMAINTKGTGATNGRLLLPAVQKHAITTKGAGANDRGVVSACAASPSPAPTMSGATRAVKPVASCALSDDGMTATVSVPLSVFGTESKTYRGHVTLMKRGEDMSAMMQEGWSPPVIIAPCTAAAGAKGGGPKAVGYDLATLKKA